MPRSPYLHNFELCQASQKCYGRPPNTNSGQGECRRYDEQCQQSPEGQFQPAHEFAAIPKAGSPASPIATLGKPKPKPPPDSMEHDSSKELSCESSAGESSFLQDSGSNLSGSAATLATSTHSSSSESKVECQVTTQRAMNHVSQYIRLRHDLEQSRRQLRETIQMCRRAEYQQVCCAISCVFNSARPLSRPELAAAVKLNKWGRDWRSIMRDEQWAQPDHWIHKCSPIFVESLDGKIDFLHPKAMRIFLRSRRIPGIDISHRTFGMISRNHFELHRFLANSPIARSNLVQAVHTLSSYVGEFGNHHLRAASLTSIIEIKANDSRDHVSEDFEMISQGTNQLSLVGEDRDWVVVKQTRV